MHLAKQYDFIVSEEELQELHTVSEEELHRIQNVITVESPLPKPVLRRNLFLCNAMLFHNIRMCVDTHVPRFAATLAPMSTEGMQVFGGRLSGNSYSQHHDGRSGVRICRKRRVSGNRRRAKTWLLTHQMLNQSTCS